MHTGFCWGNLKEEITGKTQAYVVNFKTDLKETGREGVDRINLAQDMDKWRTVVKTAVNIRVPYNGSRFLTSRGTVSFSRMVLFHRLGYVVSRLLICVHRLSTRPSRHCCHGLRLLGSINYS
jgi:hypothetical protein